MVASGRCAERIHEEVDGSDGRKDLITAKHCLTTRSSCFELETISYVSTDVKAKLTYFSDYIVSVTRSECCSR